MVAGATDWGVEVNLRGTRAAYVVAVDRLPELRVVSTGPADDGGPDRIEIGAALTLSEVERSWPAGCRCSTRSSRSSPPG